MDYNLHYDKLINKAKHRTIEGYYEKHHIIPKCVGGTDDSHNLIRLTPEEHYLAHLLLSKINPNSPSLVCAAMMMCAKRKSNKVYGWLRRKHADAMSEHQSGDKNSQFGTAWVHRDGVVIKVKTCDLTQVIDDGWSLGRKPKIIRQKLPRGIESDKYSWISDQESDILAEFDKHNSVSKILHSRGFKNREGNKILSTWLKSKGRSVLKRRNTAEVA